MRPIVGERGVKVQGRGGGTSSGFVRRPSRSTRRSALDLGAPAYRATCSSACWNAFSICFFAVAPAGRAVRALEGHASGVLGVAVTAYDRAAVSISEDRTLKLWDLDTGQAVGTLEGMSGVAMTTDGRFAVSASEDKTLKVSGPRHGPVPRDPGGPRPLLLHVSRAHLKARTA